MNTYCRCGRQQLQARGMSYAPDSTQADFVLFAGPPEPEPAGKVTERQMLDALYAWRSSNQASCPTGGALMEAR